MDSWIRLITWPPQLPAKAGVGAWAELGNMYFSNLSIYFWFPWASVYQYTVRTIEIVIFIGFCPWGLWPMEV